MVTDMNTVLRNPPPPADGARSPGSGSGLPGGPGAASGRGPMPPMVQRDDVVVLLLAAMPPGARAWGWSRVVLRDRPLRQVPGVRFVKALGSGFEGGFGVKPSFDRSGLFVTFDGEAAADAFITKSATVAGYRDHACEFFITKLRATSSKGSWSGQPMGVSAQAVPDGPVAALTRASIRLIKAPTFWSLAPAAQVDLERASGCQLAVGLGEAPLLRQATFSVWDSVAAMDAYARTGAHLRAIKASTQGDFFSETMFVRFVPLLMQGTWKGRSYG
jgi:hypothetical protein